MFFCLQVADGDLVMKGSQLGIVYGVNKLRQDLTLWSTERYGIDRFHPTMGSNLQNYIGGIISQSTNSMVYNEMNRILDNYQRIQYLGLKNAPQLYSLSELLWLINSIDVSLAFDRVIVDINVSNAEGHTTVFKINQSV